MKLINPWNSDYHMHSSNFSDWTSNIDEIVKFAWDIWLEEIAITDHSDLSLKIGFPELWNKWFQSRWSLTRWKNVFNKTNVIFWVEWDLINQDGDICSTIQWIEQNFIILSAHIWVYNWDSENITDWYINAIKKHHKKIKFIGHPCNSRCFSKYLDIEKLIKACNDYNVAMEFNASDLIRENTDINKLHIMLSKANHIYINSDAHSLYELKHHRKLAFDFLKKHWYL